MRERRLGVPIRGRQLAAGPCQVTPAKYLSGLKIRVSVVRFPPLATTHIRGEAGASRTTASSQPL